MSNPKIFSIILTILISCIFIKTNAQEFKQEGNATFYSNNLHGHRTSSGEVYDKNKLTAAHATIPLNSWVKVTNLKNNKFVIVKINDRCALRSKFIIDLSKQAAIEIDMVRDGIVKVSIEKVDYEINKSATDSTKTDIE